MKRAFRIIFRAAFIVSLAAPAAAATQPGRSSAPPNIVLITVDTLRADHLGCYGDRDIRTPNIDALATTAFRMERAYTVVPITLPSHVVMMTGTYPAYSGVHDFTARLGPNLPTLASVLHDRGYRTGAVVASAVLDSRFGIGRGFDFYYDHFDFGDTQSVAIDQIERPANKVVDAAISWLDKTGGKPFFLWVHFYDPHAPYRPPAPYSSQYPGRPYDGAIAFADAEIGRLLAFLKQKGLYRPSLIVLAGDHGEGLGEHNEKTHGFFIYDSTLHVPFILKPPGDRAGKVIATPVSLVDLMPTVLDLAEVPAPADVQGKSLKPLLSGAAGAAGSPLYAESLLADLHFNWSELHAIREQNYKLISSSKPELYDVAADPAEKHNLIADKSAVAAELDARLSSARAQFASGAPAGAANLDPAMAARLRALGYVAESTAARPSPAAGTASSKSPALPPADPKDRIGFYEQFSEALAESQAGRYEESTALLKPLLKTEPASVPVNFLLGSNYYRERQYATAIGYFQRVIDANPAYALAAFYMGLSYGESGQLDRAGEEFQAALRLDAENYSAAFNLGSVYLKQNRVAEALAAFRQSVTIMPGYAPGHRAIGEVLLYQGQAAAAVEELRKAATLAPGSPAVHMSLARALEAQGLTADAAAEKKRAEALMSEPNRPAQPE